MSSPLSTVHSPSPRRERARIDVPLRTVDWKLWTGLLLFCICHLSLICRAQDAVSKEYQIKAAYLYNFAKFVEWPAGSFTNAQSPLVIGVFGKNPFGDQLQAIAKDHKIDGRCIVIKTVTTPAETATVNLLFLSAAEDNHLAEVFAALRHASVLTVGESDKFVAVGGMIHFVREADKVRFQINNAAALRHGLKISAQLLKLAEPLRK
jgi:YfiR/HmsC-like